MSHTTSPCNCHDKAVSFDLDDPFSMAMEWSPTLPDFAETQDLQDDAMWELDQLMLDDELLAAQELDALAETDDGMEGSGDLGVLYTLLTRYPGLEITLSRKA